MVLIPDPEANAFEVLIVERGRVLTRLRTRAILWHSGQNAGTWKPSAMRRSKRETIKGPPPAPSKSDVAVAGAIHFFGQEEFTAKELAARLAPYYPHMNLNPRTLSMRLKRSRRFKCRIVRKTLVWRLDTTSAE